jgi:hypothetical protein
VTRRILLLVMLLTGGVGTGGCAVVGLTVLGIGAGVAAGTGTAYTLDGIAYRTFAAPLEDVHRASLTSLRRMEVALRSDVPRDDGRKITAVAGDRDIYLDLERLTPRTTRMRVTAKHGLLFRDRATAGEIIAQTEHALDELPALSHGRR